jgi:TonB family protein
VATETIPTPAATGGSIVLETRRGAREIPVTLHFAAVRQIREMSSLPEPEFSGLLCGRWNGGGIVLERATTAPSDSAAVGLFRMQPGGWTALTLADRKKLKAAGLSRAVVLVVRTLAQRPWSATLFSVEPDVVGGDAPLAEFPWDEYLLQNGWLLDLAPPAPHSHIMPEPKPRRSRLLMAATAMILSGAAGAAAAYQWLPALRNQQPADPPTSVTSVLGLSLVRQAQDWRVEWDRGSDLVRQASSGTLTIRRGASTRVIDLRPDQLREGLVVLQSLAGLDLDVRLLVFENGGKTVSESAQVLGLDPVPAPSVPVASVPVPPVPLPAAPPPKPAPQKTAAAVPAPAPPAGVRRPGAVAPTPSRNGPIPVRRAIPQTTSDVAREMSAAPEKVMVSVQISIDAAGQVEDAKILAVSGEPAGGGSAIRQASLSAARQWRFRPATANNKPAPSEMTVLFTF